MSNLENTKPHVEKEGKLRNPVVVGCCGDEEDNRCQLTIAMCPYQPTEAFKLPP